MKSYRIKLLIIAIFISLSVYSQNEQHQNQRQRQFQRVNVHSNDSSLIIATKELSNLYKQVKMDSKIVADSLICRASIASKKYSEFIVQRLILISSVSVILFILIAILLWRRKYNMSYLLSIILIALLVLIWMDSDHIHLVKNSDFVILKEIDSFINKK